jgi:membrane protein YqaA with SNARE-associated domain
MLIHIHAAFAAVVHAIQSAAHTTAAHAAADNSLSHRLWRFFRHLGGPGLILLGIVDNSVVPVTGSMDALTIVLAAHDRTLWPYYAFMATVGGVLGAYLTYRIGRKGGEDALERRVSPKNLRWVRKTFRAWGFGSLAVAVLLPPPAPVVPFLLAAGATKYPAQRFLAAIALGRTVRYGILAYLATIYGRQIITLLQQHGLKLVLIYASLLAALSAFAVVKYYRFKGAKPSKRPAPSPAGAAQG